MLLDKIFVRNIGASITRVIGHFFNVLLRATIVKPLEWDSILVLTITSEIFMNCEQSLGDEL